MKWLIFLSVFTALGGVIAGVDKFYMWKGGFEIEAEYKEARKQKINTKADFDIYSNDKYLLEQAEVKLVEENREADEVENMRTAALTPSLTMKCENRRGYLAYIMHVNTQATIIKPVENPVDTYNAVAENVAISNYGNPEYWYSPEDLNKGFNIPMTSLSRGFTQAKLDLRELPESQEPSFGIFSTYYDTFKREWYPHHTGIYTCSNISLAAFNAVLLKYKKKELQKNLL